jgi:mRNA interferase MazF
VLQPGDVVIVDFPGFVQTKRRPALVVSTTAYHTASVDVILAVITSNIAGATLPTDYVLQDWAAAGLRRASAVRMCLETEMRSNVIQVIGKHLRCGLARSSGSTSYRVSGDVTPPEARHE